VTAPLVPNVPPREGRFRLLVMGEAGVIATHALPALGRVTIGRDHANTIQIDDDSISRFHAALEVGPVCTIEDVGSSNGTKVRDVAIAAHRPHELGVNELVTIGSLILIVQARFTPTRTNRVASHEYMQTRVEEECARASRNSGQFALLRFRVESECEQEVVDALLKTLRQSDVLASSGHRSYAILALDASREQAEQIAQRFTKALEPLGRTSRQVAHFPTDARSAYALMTLPDEIPTEQDDHGDLVIADRSMRDLYALAKRIAVSDLPVLILGETGVGKEKLSRTIHEHSPRSDKPYVAINCAALNENLLESELFGHERGAFTGAHSMKQGLLEAAAGGTVLLDEIGDMPLALQAKLLRVLEDGEVRRVGALTSRQVGVRFLAATNVDLEDAIGRGTFREDLFFRLSAATLVIPPLRERPAEVEMLARRFAGAAGTRGTHEITGAALALLRDYSWPGNIRELRNVIERAVVLSGDAPITPEHLPVEKMRGTYVRATGTRDINPRALSEAQERARVLDALERAQGNQSRAAGLLGVSRRTLINRLEQYDLPRPRKGRSRSDDDSEGGS
jgi:transcriptional regulator with PAS, ATPase and Fis domain